MADRKTDYHGFYCQCEKCEEGRRMRGNRTERQYGETTIESNCSYNCCRSDNCACGDCPRCTNTNRRDW